MSAATAATFAACLLLAPPLTASDLDEFKIKRQPVFEFAQKPVVTRDGDTVTIRFVSRAYCDATVAIEQTDGAILRHLASGCLGPKAPEPFRKNSKTQAVVWDGKNDQGEYVEDQEACVVRVSLGLKPRFERTLRWHPKKRCGFRKMPRCVAQPEGVYVYEGAGTEYVRLFDHDGNYVRTVHPFPADKVKDVKGLGWSTFPDGYRAPRHKGYWRSTYMLGGEEDSRSKYGSSANAFAVRAGRIASISDRLCRLNTDGTCGPYPIYGPATKIPLWPQSAALSPDGKWLYLTGCYMSINRMQVRTHIPRVKWQHGVYRMEYGGEKPAELWLGKPLKTGTDNTLFDHPSDVCVDAKGRVYIADNHNDRVQIFTADGKLLKTQPVNGPAALQIHHKTQELYVFSWCMALAYGYTAPPHKTKARLRVFEPFKSDKPKLVIPLPLENYQGDTIGYMGSLHFDEVPYRATLDSYTDPPTVWLGAGWYSRRKEHIKRAYEIRRYRIEKKHLVLLEKWNDEVEKAIKVWRPTRLHRQRLYVDPRKGLLYIGEERPKAFDRLTRIDPETGKLRIVELPYGSEEVAFDSQGHIYLRCAQVIGRFDPATMREVPFDYGEKRTVRWTSKHRGGELTSGLVLPGNRPVFWHEGGMFLNPKGDIVVSCCNSDWIKQRKSEWDDDAVHMEGKKYAPPIYPGRLRYSEIHVFDKHGKVLRNDVVKGVMDGHGTCIDPQGNIYYLAGGHRVYGGNRDFFPLTGCVMKFKPGKGAFYAQKKSRKVPVPFSSDYVETKGLPQISCGGLGRFWIKGAEWIYPGIGYVHPGAPCQCWNCRFVIDTFGRVFAPETVRNQVAVLDTNGNLVMHIGRYGNVDDGVPLVEDRRFRTQKRRSVGGDEVALAYANYVATHTDRRLFIADAGNGRILSVKLGYHAEERVSLKGLPDQTRRD